MKAEAIIILGAGLGQHNEPSPRTKKRIQKGVELYKQGTALYMIMSGGIRAREGITAAESMKRYAITLGMPAKAILLEEESKDTLGNAYFCAISYIIPHSWKKIMVITSEDQVKRARYVFKKVLGKQYRIDVHGVDNCITPDEPEEDLHKERGLLLCTQVTLWMMPSGNRKCVKQLLFSYHPYYAKHPLIPKKYMHIVTKCFDALSWIKELFQSCRR